MLDAFTNLGKSIAEILESAINGDWGKLASSIVDTVGNSIAIGSSALETGVELSSSK